MYRRVQAQILDIYIYIYIYRYRSNYIYAYIYICIDTNAHFTAPSLGPVLNMSVELKTVFEGYTSSSSQGGMDGKSFAKCAKDNKLLDKRLTSTDVDLIFARIKDKGSRRITFEQFVEGLEAMAGRKGADSSAVLDKVAASQGPVLTGTKVFVESDL